MKKIIFDYAQMYYIAERARASERVSERASERERRERERDAGADAYRRITARFLIPIFDMISPHLAFRSACVCVCHRVGGGGGEREEIIRTNVNISPYRYVHWVVHETPFSLGNKQRKENRAF
jgi:hypothetical protein